jgi:hypothetical protein
MRAKRGRDTTAQFSSGWRQRQRVRYAAHLPIHRRSPWREIEAVECATLQRVNWFNNRHLLSSIGNIPMG